MNKAHRSHVLDMASVYFDIKEKSLLCKYGRKRKEEMKEKILGLLKQNRMLISYGIFGVLTTLINIGVYTVSYNKLGISNVVSNIIAWIAGVLFAFITNKIWVFESKSLDLQVLLREFMSFVGCRLVTGVMDLAIMYVSVDIMDWNSTAMKCISNVLVIILNYIFSKLVIFRKEKAVKQTVEEE